MRSRRPVLAAPTQVRVERLKNLRVEPTDLQAPENGPDVLTDLPLVPLPRTGLHVDDVEPPLKQLVDRGRRTRVPLLVHLVQETGANLLRLSPRRGDVREVQPTLRDRVHAGV